MAVARGKIEFLQALDALASDFLISPFCETVAAGRLNRWHYHSLLLSLYQQVRWNGSTLALAAAHCVPSRSELRRNLVRFAEEESERFSQIESDLRCTGYRGLDPGTIPIPQTTEAYVSYDYFVACTKPLARLAVAAHIANLRATLGGAFLADMLRQLGIDRAQATFLGSARACTPLSEIVNVIVGASPSDAEWDDLARTATTAASLYRAIYDAALRE